MPNRTPNEAERALLYAILLLGGKWPEGMRDIGEFKTSMGLQNRITYTRKASWVTVSGAITPEGLAALKQYEKENES